MQKPEIEYVIYNDAESRSRGVGNTSMPARALHEHVEALASCIEAAGYAVRAAGVLRLRVGTLVCRAGICIRLRVCAQVPVDEQAPAQTACVRMPETSMCAQVCVDQQTRARAHRNTSRPTTA